MSGAEKRTRVVTGKVVSNKMDKTITVLLERRVKHPVIGKTMTRSKKYHAHVDAGEFAPGDLVEIAECRPLSATKSWRVTRLLRKSAGV